MVNQEQLQSFIKNEFPGEDFDKEVADIEIEVSRYPGKWQLFIGGAFGAILAYVFDCVPHPAGDQPGQHH